MDRSRPHVLDSCSVHGAFTIERHPRQDASAIIARFRKIQRLQKGVPLAIEELIGPNRPEPRMEERRPAITVVLAPSDKTLARQMENNGYLYELLGRKIRLELNSKYQVHSDEEFAERARSIKAAAAQCHYLRLDTGRELVVFGKPLVLLPNRKWRPAGREKRRSQRRRNQPATPAERKEEALYIRCLEFVPQRKDGATESPLKVLSNYPKVIRSARRFGIKQTLDYPYVSGLKLGDELAPRYHMTRAYDPDLPGERNQPNALTDFADISIPLSCPDDWNHPAYAHLQSLRSWGASYEAFVLFLEGKHLDSLEELIAPEHVVVEHLPKNAPVRGSCRDRDRRGQCYHGDYNSLTVVGPYFIFEVASAERTIYLLDSPLYGIALRAFRQKEHAVAYAQGGDPRRRVLQDPTVEVWHPVKHDPDGKWITYVQSKLQEHLSAVASPVA